VLTSKVLTPDENSIDIGAMLQAAAAAAIKMPQLETMEIWNGRKGLAALFKYQAFRDIQEAIIICHAKTPVSLGTLPAKLPPLYLSFTPTYLLRKSKRQSLYSQAL
jgi:hypothetical protein